MPARTLQRPKPASREDVLRRYPRICAHIICESLGYATPMVAGSILLAAIKHEKHYCEWVMACFGCDPVLPVKDAIRRRHSHRGYMSEFGAAYALVRNAIQTGKEPIFGSWF